MTALDTPFNPGQSRGQAPQVGRQGIQLTPNAPGLVPTPPVSQGASQLRQMIDAIGLAGQLGRTAGSIADNELRRREFLQRDHDRLYEAAASVEARVAITEIQTKIQNGEIEVPEGVSVGDFSAQLAQARLPDDAPDAYKSRYQSILVPEVAARIASKQAADIEQARRENVKLLAEGVYSMASTPEEMMAAVDEARRIDPNLSMVEAKASVLLPAMQVAIEQGNTTTFDVVAKALGPEFPTTIARARLQVENQRLINDQRDSTQRMKDATQIVDSLIGSEYLTDQHIRESIDSMQLDSTQKATLLSRLNNRRSEQLAVLRSDQRQLIESIHDRATTPMELRVALDRNAEALGLSQAEVEREVQVYARAEITLAANNGDLEKIEALKPAIGEGADAQLLIEEAQSVAVNVIRDKRFSTMINGLQAGAIGVDTVREFAKLDAQRAIDNPDSHEVLSTAQRSRLLQMAGEREQADLSLERVSRGLSGDGRVVITSQDDSAIDRILGPQQEGGSGMIDANNNITDPARLGASIAMLNRVTPATRDVVMTNLMSGQPDQQVQAMQAIAVIAQGRPGLLAEFAGDDMKAGAIIAEIRTMNDRGIVGTMPGVARERIAAMMTNLSETTLNSRVVDARIKDDGLNIEKEIDLVLNSAASEMPWYDPPGLINKAPLVDPNDEVGQYLTKQFEQQYFYQRSQGVNKADATKFARRTSQELLVRNFDFVRFNGETHAHRIDDGTNRLREDYRWSDGYDKLVGEFIQKSGYEVDDVFTVRPTTGYVVGNQGEAIQGWLLIDTNLDPITDDQGRVLIWEPPAKLRDRALQVRDLLESRSSKFNEQSQRKQGDSTFEGLDMSTIMSIP